MHFSVFGLIPFLGAITSLILGVVVFRERGRQTLGRVFAVLTVMLVAWNLHFVALYSIVDQEVALRVAGYFRWGSILLQPLVLHITLTLRRTIPLPWKCILVADYALASVILAGDLSGQLVTGLHSFPWGYYSVGGGLYGLFSALVFGNVILSTLSLGLHYRVSSDPTERLQLKFWFLGLALALPLALTNLLPAYGIPFYPLGGMGNVAWASVVAYAIARHRLMSIDIVAMKGASYLLVSAGLLIPLIAAVTFLQQRTFGSVSMQFSAIVCILTFGCSFVFPYLRSRVESRFASSFLGDALYHRESIRELTRSIVRIFDSDKLIREVATGLHDALDAESVSLGLIDPTHHRINLVYAAGVAPESETLDGGNPLICWIEDRLTSLTRAEALVRDGQNGSPALTESLDSLRWDLCLPLASGGKLLGVIGLGKRRNLGAYSAEDLDLLDTLAAEVGFALENARLNAELRKSQNLIQRADRSSALGVLAAGIAHEVRNPLVSIRTFFQLAPERLDDDEFMTSFLSMASSEVDRISKLINELLSFARSPTPNFSDVDLNELAEGTALLIGPEAKKLRVSIDLSLAASPVVVYGNHEQLRQAMLNLTFNALQASDRGDTVTIATRSVTFDSIDYGEVEIRDTGRGIPAEEQARIFDPFFTSKPSGTGLGLAIVSQITEEHDGKIFVESNLGVGSSFRLDIPVRRSGSSEHNANNSSFPAGKDCVNRCN